MENLDLTTAEQAFVDKHKALVSVFKSGGKTRGIVRGLSVDKRRVKANDWNPNRMQPIAERGLQQSLGEFGQVLEVVCAVHPSSTADAISFVVVDGEHRYSQLDEFVSINVLLSYSEPELKKLTVILNETRGEADKIELSRLLSSISDDFEGDLGLGLPMSERELSELVALTAVDWGEFSVEFGGDDDEPSPIDDDSNNDEPAPPAESPLNNTQHWVDIVARVPEEDAQTVLDAHDVIAKQLKANTGNKAACWGEVLSTLVAFFNANGGINQFE